jgi:hypothetical protein
VEWVGASAVAGDSVEWVGASAVAGDRVEWVGASAVAVFDTAAVVDTAAGRRRRYSRRRRYRRRPPPSRISAEPSDSSRPLAPRRGPIRHGVKSRQGRHQHRRVANHQIKGGTTARASAPDIARVVAPPLKITNHRNCATATANHRNCGTTARASAAPDIARLGCSGRASRVIRRARVLVARSTASRPGGRRGRGLPAP